MTMHYCLGYCLWGIRLHMMPHVLFLGLGWVLLPLWGKIQKLGKLRLVGMILISAGLGTMAVLVGSVVVAVILRNYLGVVIGTWHILGRMAEKENILFYHCTLHGTLSVGCSFLLFCQQEMCVLIRWIIGFVNVRKRE